MSAQSLWIYYQIAVWAGTWVIAYAAWRGFKVLKNIEALLREKK